jgi:(E)-4-hydroxy-3-methyl-but-2-enyl pyrophosphate reductase
MNEIRVAKTAGFCFGVDRSVKMAKSALQKYGRVYCLGQLIHNNDVVEKLQEEGMITVHCPCEISLPAPVLIRSHGIPYSTYKDLESMGVEIIDATCPKVLRIHNIVRNASDQGRFVIIMGMHKHPEVAAIEGWCDDHVVVESPEELEYFLLHEPDLEARPLTMVVQTTQTSEKWVKCKKLLKKLYTNAETFDTICNATSARQEEASKLAAVCDAMVVIGGKHSANSNHLAEICKEYCSNVQFIANADELNLADLKSAGIVGITAGASAPAWIIKEVKQKMVDEMNNAGTIGAEAIAAEETKSVEETAEQVTAKEDIVEEQTASSEAETQKTEVKETEDQPAEAEDTEVQGTEAKEVQAEEKEQSFDEMLEASFKTVHNGDHVTGTVVSVTPTEVNVDLGIKYSGIIPTTEFTADGTNAEEVVKEGDEIEAVVVKVNDMEGTVKLSKKRLDAMKNWENIEKASQDGSVQEGIVTEVNKGGLVVTVNGSRVFVPASQSGQPRDADLNKMLKQNVRLVITEVNRGRKRVVGSIRRVLQAERKAAAEKVWNEIEVGKHYKGVVKSMTGYGAFIDIGGVDGMVHVSELSWNRIKQPSDVLNIGDEVEVYVLGFDKEQHRISLGYKDPEKNPWNIFKNSYSVGDVAKVKIVKLMPFGAFAEIVPGVDGLIHISQIANRRIGKPEDVLTVGEEVQAKITSIDNDNEKVSLSIRALLDNSKNERQKPDQEVPRDSEEEQDSGEDALVYEISENGEAKGNIETPDEAESGTEVESDTDK